MAVRDTQHYTEVLQGDSAGTIVRATQQYVEVLSRGPINLAFVDNLAVTQAASCVKNWPASDALALSQSVSVTRIQGDKKTATVSVTLSDSVVVLQSKAYPVTHTLVLADVARYSPINVSITDTLSLTDSATANTLFLDVTHQLNLSDEAVIQRLGVQEISDALTLNDLARLQSRSVTVLNSLNLQDTAICIGPRYVNASDVLQIVEPVLDPVTLTFTISVTGGLQDSVLVATVLTHPASNIISLADVATEYILRADAIDESASDSLSLDDSAKLSTVLDASDLLALTDSALAISGTPIAQTLELLDSVTLNIARANAELVDNLSLRDAVRFILERNCLRFRFSPMIGSSTDPDAPTAPSSELPADSGITGFRLQYPSSGTVTDEVIITKGPEFGNIDRFQMDRINRETRGGTLLVYADPIWPKITTLVMRFSSLNSSVAQALLDFMETHPGEEIKLIDWENRAWTGVITNPQDPVVEDSPGSFTASFEFEGERV